MFRHIAIVPDYTISHFSTMWDGVIFNREKSHYGQKLDVIHAPKLILDDDYNSEIMYVKAQELNLMRKVLNGQIHNRSIVIIGCPEYFDIKTFRQFTAHIPTLYTVAYWREIPFQYNSFYYPATNINRSDWKDNMSYYNANVFDPVNKSQIDRYVPEDSIYVYPPDFQVSIPILKKENKVIIVDDLNEIEKFYLDVLQRSMKEIEFDVIPDRNKLSRNDLMQRASTAKILLSFGRSEADLRLYYDVMKVGCIPFMPSHGKFKKFFMSPYLFDSSLTLPTKYNVDSPLKQIRRALSFKPYIYDMFERYDIFYALQCQDDVQKLMPNFYITPENFINTINDII